jgi:DNA-binding MarR family transcriptional regulator
VILLAIAARSDPTIATLARELVMDPSTLNRNLQPLTRQKLVRSKASPDGRRKLLSLTPKGEKTVEGAVPLWQATQSAFIERLGAERWEMLRACLQDVAAMSRHG